MRKGFLVVAVAVAVLSLGAGRAGKAPVVWPGVPGVAHQASTVRVADLAATAPAAPRVAPAPRKTVHAPRRLPVLKVPPEARGKVTGPPTPPVGLGVSSPSPARWFQALDDNNTAIPPDVHGAVGPAHAVVTLNSQLRIQGRGGNLISTATLDSFWASLGNPNAFDPKIVYDPYGGRFAFTAVADARAATSSVLVGVSQTSDPTGTWNLYKVDADAADLAWADYPSLGFNKDWIVVQVNMFAVADDAFVRSQIYAFRKANLYSGGAGLFTLFSDASIGGTQTPALTYDPAASTLYLVQNFNGNSGGQGFLRVYSITGPVGGESLTTGPWVVSPETWDTYPPGISADFAPQLGSTQKFQNNDARVQNVVYRGGHLWCAQSIFLPAGGAANRCSVQWWQITPAGSVVQRGRVDDPSADRYHAFPTIAVNALGDALVGFARFSPGHYASACYAYRASSDGAGMLRDAYVAKDGEAAYYKTFGSGRNRWGDYTASAVDPLSDVAFWTVQQFAALPQGGWDRWGTWWVAVAQGLPADGPAIYLGGSAAWYLRNAASGGVAHQAFTYGPATTTWVPLRGDWNGDGVETIGLYDPASGGFYLRNSNGGGVADVAFVYGPGGAGWLPLSGDWDNDGDDTVGLYNPATGTFYLRNTNSAGAANVVFTYGPGGLGWKPLTGDWDGDGDDTVGVYNPATGFFYVRNTNSGGAADATFGFGPGGAGWLPLAGDWDRDGDDTPGLYAPSSATFYFKNTLAGGAADASFVYGPANAKPLVGNWDGL